MKNWTSTSLLTLAGFSLLGGCGHMTGASMEMMQSQNAATEMAMVRIPFLPPMNLLGTAQKRNII